MIRIGQNPVVKIHIERDVVSQALDLLARAPGSSEEPVDVRPEHRAGVIERKHRIKAFVPKLALPCDGPSPARDPHVSCGRQVLVHPRWVVRVLIGGDLAIRGKERPDALEQ